MSTAPRTRVVRDEICGWVATCDHGESVWCINRGTEHLARRSLAAHVRHEHGERDA